jgi:anti-anti-sigma regulatory factor
MQTIKNSSLIELKSHIIQLESEVEAIDTAGVQLLAVCRINALEKGKTFRIASESEPVREALKLTGLGSMLEDSNKT